MEVKAGGTVSCLAHFTLACSRPSQNKSQGGQC